MGYAALFAGTDAPDLAPLTKDLGGVWEIQRAIDAILALRARHAIDPARVREIRVGEPPVLRRRGDAGRPARPRCLHRRAGARCADARARQALELLDRLEEVPSVAMLMDVLRG